MIVGAFGDGQVAYAFLWFFLFFIEIWLLIMVFMDLFRRRDMSGWVKAIWILIVLLIPLIGILLYLVFYGGKMREHAIEAQREQEEAFRSYVRQAAGGQPSTTEELQRLADLKANGSISDEEYQRLKGRLVS